MVTLPPSYPHYSTTAIASNTRAGRLTAGDMKATRTCEALNISPNDSRFYSYLNESVERLLHMGKWWGTLAKYQLTSTANLVTLPPQIAAVEAIALCGCPTRVNDMIYEFIGHGWGTENNTCNSGTDRAVYQGEYPVFSDISGSGKKARFICDLSDDVGKQVRVLGYDDAGNWVRKQVSGTWVDGELMTLAQAPGTLSTTKFGMITALQFPTDSTGKSLMMGQTWLYEYDTVALTQRLIGQYDYATVRPAFSRWLFPSIPSNGSLTVTVEALVKLAFIPVAVDTDYLVLTNRGAVKLGCMAVKAEEEHNWAEANLLWYGGAGKNGNTLIGAKQLLEAELDHHLGSGRQIGMNIVGSAFGEPVVSIAL